MLFIVVLFALNIEAGNQLGISNNVFAKIPRHKGVNGLSVKHWKDAITSPNEDKIIHNDWLIGIIIIGAVFVGLFLLNMIIVIMWCTLFLWDTIKCCICRCCGCKRRNDIRKKPIKKKMYWTLLMTILASIIVAIFAAINYVAHKDLSDKLLYNNKFNVHDSALEIFRKLDNRMIESSKHVERLQREINQKVAEMERISKDEKLDEIKGLYQDIQRIINEIIVDDENYQAISETATEMVSDIQTILDDLYRPISHNKDKVIGQLGKLNSILMDASKKLEQVNYKVNRINIKKYDKYRWWAYCVIFSIAMVPISIILVGDVLKSSFAFSLSYKLLWFSSIIMALLLAIHYPGSVLMTDICAFANKYDYDVNNMVSKELGETDFSKVLQSCVDRTKIIDGLNMRKHLKLKYKEFPLLTLIDLQKFRDVETEINTKVDDMQLIYDKLQMKTQEFIQLYDFNELNADIKQTINSLECGFIKKRYIKTKKLLCNNVSASNNMIVLSMLMILIFGMIGCICSIKLRNMYYYYDIKHHVAGSSIDSFRISPLPVHSERRPARETSIWIEKMPIEAE